MSPLDHYWKLAETERGFNDSQAGIRTLASAWLLVGIGAVGLLLRSEGGSEWLIARGSLIVLVCTLSGTGLATLWVMDQLVFHRLLDAVFLVGIRMEFQNSNLPPIRSMMMMSAEGRGMHRWQRLFYLVPMIAFLMISALVVTGPLDRSAGSAAAVEPAWLAGARWFLLGFQAIVLLWVMSKQTGLDFVRRAAMFGDQRFTRLVREQDYASIIRNYRGAPPAPPSPPVDDSDPDGERFED